MSTPKKYDPKLKKISVVYVDKAEHRVLKWILSRENITLSAFFREKVAEKIAKEAKAGEIPLAQKQIAAEESK